MVDIFLYEVPAFAGVADIMLSEPGVAVSTQRGHSAPWRDKTVCPIHPPGLCNRHFSSTTGWYCVAVRPEARSLHTNLLAEYGTIEGNKTYLAMRHNAQGPFAPGAKYDVTSSRSRARSANGGRREEP